jgi:hypothetical protein
VERFFEYMNISEEKKKGEIGSLQVQRRSISLVGKVAAISIEGREKTRNILVQNETATQCPIPTT